MSKGLEAIKRIKWKLEDEGILGEEYELCDVVEKELKVLEIIKKYVGIQESYDELFPYDIVDKQYASNSSELIISKEEYELLKEVLL